MLASDPTNPRPRLDSFFRQRCDVHDVFRALVSYDHWLVPVPALVGHYGRPRPGRELSYGNVADFPPGELWLFTDDDAAHAAKLAGCNLGTYAVALRGVELFESLSPDWVTVRVNPVSPPEQTWNFPAEAFGVLSAWAAVIRFEDSVRAWAGGRTPDYPAVRRYNQFHAFVFPNKTVLTMPEQGGLVNPAVVCTAPDCAREILSRVPEPMRSGLTIVYTNGHELMDKLPEQGMDGLILNPAGPGPTSPLRLKTP